MKILFPLHLFYPSKIGGPANTIYWLCKALVKKGHEVTVVSTSMGIEKGCVNMNKWSDIDGIKVRYCRSLSKHSFPVILHSVKCLNNNDIVVFSSICFIPNFFIGLAATFCRKKIIWSPRGELFDSAIQGNKGKIFFFHLIRHFFGKRICFHATSEMEEKAILKYFPKAKVVKIPNYMEIPEKIDVDSIFADFLFVGRIAPIKALDKLIMGLGLSENFRKSKSLLKIVGGVETQFKDYYQKLIELVEELGLSNKVVFLGSQTGKEKFASYANARYSFLISNSENFGNVVIEALSQGTPVVTSKGTPWEKLSQVKAGFWIDNTPEEISKVVDKILNQTDDEYRQYRLNALHYSKTFDVYEHVSEWEEALRYA